MKKFRLKIQALKLLFGYWLLAKGNGVIARVCERLFALGEQDAAFAIALNHHTSLFKTHYAIAAELVAPALAKMAEQPKVTKHQTQQGEVEAFDWTESPTSQEVAKTAMPSILTGKQMETKH